MSWFLTPYRVFDPLDLDSNVWRHFQEMDRSLDRQFRYHEREMEHQRRQLMDQFKQEGLSNLNLEDTSYSKETHSVDQRSALVNGSRIRQKTLETIKEKDGVRMPHLVKEITCDPPCDLKTVRDFVKMRELTESGGEKALLSQFLKDAKDKNIDAKKLIKYQNEVIYDSESGKNNYGLNVSFLDKDNKKQIYSFNKAQDAIQAEAKFEAFAIEQEREAPQIEAKGLGEQQHFQQESKGPAMMQQTQEKKIKDQEMHS